MERFQQLGAPRNETSVVVEHAEESLKPRLGVWGGERLDGFYPLGARNNTPGRYTVAKVLHLQKAESTFLAVDKDSVLRQ